jgi:hypothetical protein
MSTSEPVNRWNSWIPPTLRTVVIPRQRPPWLVWTGDLLLAIAVATGSVITTLGRPATSTVTVSPPALPDTPEGVPAPPQAPTGVVVHHYGAVHLWQLLLAVLIGLPLVARRHYPIATLWAVVGASELYHLDAGFNPAFSFAACVIAGYSCVVYGIPAADAPFAAARGLAAVGSTLAAAGLLVASHQTTMPSAAVTAATLLVLLVCSVGFNLLVRTTLSAQPNQVDTVDHPRSSIWD